MIEDEKMIEINRAIWGTVDHMFKGETNESQLYATCAVLLQTAIELYTISLTDENIERILNESKDKLPELRERMQKRLGERVFH